MVQLALALATALALAALGAAQTGRMEREPAPLDPLKDPEIWGFGDIGGPSLVGPRPYAPTIAPADWLVVPAGPGVDAWSLASRWAVDPESPAPRAGETAPAVDGSARRWEPRLGARVEGAACAFTTIECASDDVRMARLPGGDWLLVGGELYVGDPERRGHRGVPVALKKGANKIVVGCSTAAFELSLWKSASRLVIETGSVRWPNDETAFGDVSYTIFNASLSPTEAMHAHYGHAVGEPGDCKPRLTDWSDGGWIGPLGLLRCASPYDGFNDCDPRATHEYAVVPVATWVDGDEEADRQLLRRPLSRIVGRAATAPRRSDGGAPQDVDLTDRILEDSLIVYGTRGTREASAASAAHARYLQQLVWYRTGAIPGIVSDAGILHGLGVDQGRKTFSEVRDWAALCSVVLLGNADTNALWAPMFEGIRDFEVREGRLRIGGTQLEGDDFCGWIDAAAFGPEHTHPPLLAIADSGHRGARAAAGLTRRAHNHEAPEFAFFRAHGGRLEPLEGEAPRRAVGPQEPR